MVNVLSNASETFKMLMEQYKSQYYMSYCDDTKSIYETRLTETKAKMKAENEEAFNIFILGFHLAKDI